MGILRRSSEMLAFSGTLSELDSYRVELFQGGGASIEGDLFDQSLFSPI